MDTFSFLAAATVTDTTWRRCNAVTAPGSLMTNSKVLTPTVAANTSGVIWDVATDPNGKMDGMTFSKGTNAHHAIEFGTTSPTEMTLTDCVFTGFNAANTQDDSTFHFKRTSGAITLNLPGCSGNFSYRSDGATPITINAGVVTQLTVTDSDTGSPIENARALILVSNGVNFPHNASVTITSSGTTATVSHATHGYASGQFVNIQGAVEDAYNGCFSITVTGASAYTYTMQATASSPATGTITATTAIINALTNSSGVVSDTRTYTNDQPITGRVRLGTGSFYKQSSITDTISKTAGKSINVQLIPDV